MTMTKTDLKKILMIIAAKYPIVARDFLEEATGGLLKGSTMRNLDSKRKGIKGKFTLRDRKVGYTGIALVNYLLENIEVAEDPIHSEPESKLKQ